ncbi:MAG TPA: DUF305 domain-containing protein [Longimicrobium sp.]|nr:DUF305 domain-containing protein [Longimicrobium sp.]
MRSLYSKSIAAATLLVATAACGAATAQTHVHPPAAPAPTSAPAAARADTARKGYTQADVRFMQGMIGHHAQAVVMTRMVPTHTQNSDLQLLAQRIDLSQQDEMATMRRWLEARGEAVPAAGEHAGHGGHHAGSEVDHAAMPGMLTAAELARLDAARGPEFDALFLELMIRHHEGALVMVEQLLASPGAGQEPELFGFASDVDADQRAEIARMQRMLAATSPMVRP